MTRLRAVLVSLVLAAGLLIPAGPVAASSPETSIMYVPVSTRVLPDGTRVVLSKVWAANPAAAAGPAAITPLSAGQWHAGCQMTGYSSTNKIWTYTVWQDFWSNGSYITYFPLPAKEATSWLGWVLTSGPDPTHWWISYPYIGAARGNYTFTYYNLYGQPGSSSSGYVEITVNYAGTWSCQGA